MSHNRRWGAAASLIIGVTVFGIRRQLVSIRIIATCSIAFLLTVVGGSHDSAKADVPIGGYSPIVGFGLTDEFKDENDSTFWITDTYTFPVGNWLGNGTPHFDVALLDTGAAVHLITAQARQDFDLVGLGFDGTQTIELGGATGTVTGLIEDPLSIFVAGLADRTGTAPLAINSSDMRGQASVAIVSATAGSPLPNVVGLPLLSQFATHILADQPQIFELDGRTVRSPQIDFQALGSGGGGILRRAPINFRPNDAFLALPQYLFNFNNILEELSLHENPISPTAVGLTGGGLFLNTDITHDGNSEEDLELLLDTGASVSAVSEIVAAQLGFDPILDEPDFRVTIIGSGGAIDEVPGFYADELDIPTVGGTFTLFNVPLVVLDIADPGDAGNIVDGIIGTNLFSDRNIIIDPNPATGGGGASPSLYISDPVTETHAWAAVPQSADWHTTGSWSAAGTPGVLWVADVINVSGTDQEAVVASDSQIFRATVAGSGIATMDVRVQNGATLLVFGGITVKENGAIVAEAGGTIDAQFVDLDGGEASGTGTIRAEFENRGGVVAPGESVGSLTIEGIFANRPGGTVAIELGGTTQGSEYDHLFVDGNAILGGELDVSLVDIGSGPFIPAVGDTFDILSASAGINGSFDTLMLPNLATWSIFYGLDTVTLEVLSLALIPGDFDLDGDVDGDDFLAWQAGFGTIGGASLSDGDANGDGNVDGDDFLIWQTNFGSAFGGGSWTVVPEPATCGLLLVLCLCVVTRLGRTR